MQFEPTIKAPQQNHAKKKNKTKQNKTKQINKAPCRLQDPQFQVRI